MNIYANRLDPAYRTRLQQLLQLTEPAGLVTSAIRLPAPVRSRGRQFDRTIGIDYFGFCGTTLFDRGHVAAPRCIFPSIDTLARETKQLNLNGIAVRLRVLLVYPYSVAGQNRIHAEMNRRRAAISDPKFHRGSGLMEQLCDESFQRSSLVTTLDRVIGVIEDWRETIGDDHELFTYPNRFDTRFICVNPFVCGLRINQQFFFDNYLLAKADRFDNSCANDLVPVVELDGGCDTDLRSYRGFCDHFRFLLDHDATIDYRDAVRSESNSPRLLRPDEISYLETARRVLRFEKRDRDERRVREYTKTARQKLFTLCPPIRRFNAKEVAFVACNWRGHPARPVAEADAIQALMRRDFATSIAGDGVSKAITSTVDVRVVIAQPGGTLSESIYRSLNEATLGIVILSPEVTTVRDDGTTSRSAKPNVYHELGYLMAKLPPGRVLVLQHSAVDSPSNIGDLVTINYDPKNIQVAYTELLVSLWNLGLFSSRTEFERVMRRHLKALEADVVNRRITHEDLEWALEVAKRCSASPDRGPDGQSRRGPPINENAS